MDYTIGFIGGGQMAEALIKGMTSSQLFAPSAISLIEPNPDRLNYMEQQYGVNGTTSHEQFCTTCDIVVLAVKPQVMEKALASLQPHLNEKHLIITIAAGLPLRYYETTLSRNDLKLVRVMPNTPALVMTGASALSRNTNVTDGELELAQKILNAVGITVLLDESYLDAVTGLSGSGPAYVFSFIEALIDAGIKVGLSRDDSEALTLQTILGSVKLMQQEKLHPAVLRARVTSPGGTTIAGLHHLERQGFSGIVMDAVELATIRSKELGDK